MLKLTQYDTLYTQSEILENMRKSMREADATDEQNIRQVAAVLAIALQEDSEFIKGALRQ